MTNSAFLEIKSISITRLKQLADSISLYHADTWNQKYLDYEIETRFILLYIDFRELEIKSISITRLKHWFYLVIDILPCTWNQKYLDYEIETIQGANAAAPSRTWNQKYLDYEIETVASLSL